MQLKIKTAMVRRILMDIGRSVVIINLNALRNYNTTKKNWKLLRLLLWGSADKSDTPSELKDYLSN